MTINIICAVNNKGYIGKDGKLLYRIKKDLERFKSLTIGHSVVMGRKTFEEIGKPLPNRINYVVSNDPSFKPEGVKVINDYFIFLLNYIDITKNLFVLGGEGLFNEAVLMSDKVFITEIDDDSEGDTVFPYDLVKHNYKIDSESDYFEENGLKFKFIDYKY